MQCQAQKYDSKRMDYERCPKPGQPHHVAGILVTVLADLCGDHVEYFRKAG